MQNIDEIIPIKFKKKANNHEECSSDITLENLKCSVQTYLGGMYLRRKSSEGTSFGIVSLAFSNFL